MFSQKERQKEEKDTRRFVEMGILRKKLAEWWTFFSWRDLEIVVPPTMVFDFGTEGGGGMMQKFCQKARSGAGKCYEILSRNHGNRERRKVLPLELERNCVEESGKQSDRVMCV